MFFFFFHLKPFCAFVLPLYFHSLTISVRAACLLGLEKAFDRLFFRLLLAGKIVTLTFSPTTDWAPGDDQTLSNCSKA